MQARHDVQGEGGAQPLQEQGIVSKWRQKERLKTTAVALVLCLNIGVDPPDVIKISPCARLECWVDPLSMQPPKALETIGGHSTPSMALLCQSLPHVIETHQRQSQGTRKSRPVVTWISGHQQMQKQGHRNSSGHAHIILGRKGGLSGG